jgi:hypothetical protein
MKFSAARFFLFVILGAILLGINGCATEDPENSSPRPWNSPQGWENGMPMMNQQHR